MNPILTAILLAIAVGGLSWSLARRFLPLMIMQSDVRWGRPFKRILDTLKYAFGQIRFLRTFERFHGIAHVAIFWGALVVTLNTLHVIGRGFVEDWYLPGFGHSDLGLAYAAIKDLFTLFVMAGCSLALYNRIFKQPARMILSAEALIILFWIFGMMAMDVLYESTLFMLHPDHPEQATAFLGVYGRQVLAAQGLTAADPATSALYALGFWGHLLLAFSFVNYLPYCKQFHEITSLPAIFMHKLSPRGALKRIDFEDEDPLFGVEQIENFSWKRGLDMYTCAECGRCRANCPAHITEKPLSPMQVIMDEREHLKRKSSLLCKAAIAKYRQGRSAAQEIIEQWNGESLIGDVITEDVIWSCTTCGHCIANCPLLIEHVDNLIDLRRHLVQVESRFPKKLRQTFRGIENLSNPWGMASNTRGNWFKDLGVRTIEAHPNAEYLFYVGCAGSFDDRYKKVTTAFARILKRADVDFACLGNDEACCGETARRLGNEYLAQELIQSNIEMWKTLNVKKIITACPHCFNTFRNEYPQFGGNFEVIHHTQMIHRLIEKAHLKPVKKSSGLTPVVYHDSCYLGRYNDMYDTPRELLHFNSEWELKESERKKRIGFCCGAGGGQMWMEETQGKRINQERLEQLMVTGAKTVATACPYCMIMLDDAAKELDLEEEVEVKDLAQLILQQMDA